MVPRPTIADVARAAGVSRGAVSFALNDRPGVADATRARILAVAAELGFTPSHRARALSSSRSADGRAGDRPPAGDAQRRPVLPRLHRRDRDDPLRARPGPAAAGGAGPGVRAPQLRDARCQRSGRRRVPHRPAGRGPQARPARVAEPAGRRDRPRPDRRRPGPSSPSTTDPASWPPSSTWSPSGTAASPTWPARRSSSTPAPASRPGPTPWQPPGSRQSPCVWSDFSPVGRRPATQQLLDLPEPPTAIVYANDLMAIAGMSAAQARGLHVPDDLSVTGFDDTAIAVTCAHR